MKLAHFSVPKKEPNSHVCLYTHRAWLFFCALNCVQFDAFFLFALRDHKSCLQAFVEHKLRKQFTRLERLRRDRKRSLFFLSLALHLGIGSTYVRKLYSHLLRKCLGARFARLFLLRKKLPTQSVVAYARQSTRASGVFTAFLHSQPIKTLCEEI